MAIIKSVKNSHSSIKHIINYVTKQEKTIGKKLCSAFNCSIDTAVTEMETTKKLYGKTGGRTYKHFVQSFSPEEEITSQQAHNLAGEFVKECPLFSDFEVAYATHVDKHHIHTHFVVNSVSFADGHKFSMSKKDLEDMKILNNKLCLKHGLSVCELAKKKSFDGQERKGLVAYNMDKYQFLKKAQEGKVKSFVQETAIAVFNSMEESLSKDDFIKSMEQKGYAVVWKDTHKYITFINQDGKKVRNSNLQKTYNMKVGKEELIQYFKEKSCSKEKKHTVRHRRR